MRHVFTWVVILAVLTVISGCGGNAVIIPERGDESGNAGISLFTGPDPNSPGNELIQNLLTNDIRDLPQWLDDEVLIVLHDGVNPASLHRLAGDMGLSLIEEIELMWATVYRMRITNGESVESMVAALQAFPEIRYAEPNVLLYPCAAPSYPDDEMFEYDDDGDPYNHPMDCWYPNVLGASLVWLHTKGSGDVVVAVVDMGIRNTHEDLANSIWINEDEIPDNGIDDDDNGFIDDWWGWDFCDQDNDPWDDWHGTPCAGVIASEQDNDVGISGVAPGCKVMAVRLDASVMGTTISSLMAGVQYSYDNGADIVTMSLRSYIENEILHETFIAVYDNGNGMLPIGGAGNENASDYTYPCSWPEVIEVGASCSFYSNGNRRDVKRIIPADLGWGSNYGEHLDVVAPGHWIVTPHMAGDDQYWDGIIRKTSGGCSMATPETAACCALIKSVNPEMTAGEIRERLIETCDDLDEPGHDIQTGWGRPNVWRAIFGSDPNAGLYDVNGHIPMSNDGEWMFDNLFDMPASDDYDTEDVFVLDVPSDGWLYLEMDIITTGEDFDLELYSSPELDVLIASSTGPNGELNPLEEIALEITQGMYYMRMISAGPNNCSNYRLKALAVPLSWWVKWESLAPSFALPDVELIPLMQIEIHTNTPSTTPAELRAYLSGKIPLINVNTIRLYEDINKSGLWESWADTQVGSVVPSDEGVNQIIFGGLDSHASIDDPLRYFIIAEVTPGPGEHPSIGVGLKSYKDITIIEDIPIWDDPFPIFSELTIVGEDNDPPVWDTTIGIQLIEPMWESGVVYWNSAVDEWNGPVMYHLYWDDDYPPEINVTQAILDIPSEPEIGYDHAVSVSGMPNGITYYFCIRTADQLGNEDTNEVWLEVTPGAYSNPEHPIAIGALALAGTSGELCVRNQVAYIVNSSYGIAIVDCANPTTPTLIDSYAVAGCSGIKYHESQDYIYAACSTGLIIIDPDGSGGPTSVGSYALANTTNVAVDSNLCFLGTSSGSLYVIDVTNPALPEYKGDITLGDGWSIYGIAARDGYAYCCMYSDGLQIVDASDPTAPYVVKHLPLQSYLYEIDLWGDYAFVTNYKNTRFYIVDISDPPNAFQAVEQSLREGFGFGIAVRDDEYVYVGESSYANALCVYKWSELGDVHKVDELPLNSVYGLEYDGQYLYVVEAHNGLTIII